MTTKHTPGPWKENGLRIEDSNGDVIAVLNTGDGIERAKIDARLIAAAPELLEAIKNLVPDRDSCLKCDKKHTCEVHALIAKAEGK